ncbi:MAG: 4-hydroxythreonine-4-phosphate dehydrogenase PdxA [Prevotella sp.]|nr:4-hydroxythreonine-4-phosphate dehydrogenase PdxA [Prevotella sp.]
MEERKIRVAVTHGDTNGIGYEVIFKAFEDPMMFDLCTPIIYGSPKVASYHRKALGMEVQFTIIDKAEDAREGRLNLLTTFDEEVKVELGTPTAESDTAARKAIARAKEDLQKGLYDVLVQAPMRSSANPAKEEKSLTMMVSDGVRIGLVTTHLPLKDVPAAVTVEKIVDKATIFHASLRRDFRISNPRIALLALNPQLGTEEETVIQPAIEQLEKQGVQAFGPYVADDYFGEKMYYDFDGALAMYDDQGLVPFKTLALDGGVKLKAGISAVCTTPDHGPAFDIAGKGVADAQSMRHAIYTAIDMLRHRISYDEPLAHPLPKLYHEKREDGDKARFAVRIPPKKTEESIPESMED